MELSHDHARLARLLGGEDLAWLVDRVRRRLERAEPLDGSVALTDATPEQRHAVQRLLGRRPRAGRTLQVSLPAVDEVLRRSGACPDGLAAAVVALTGPVTVRSSVAAARERAWQAAFAPVQTATAARPELAAWYEQLHGSGLVRRLAGTPEAAVPLLAEVAAVLDQLPASGEPLGRFAARVTGDAHALDDDRPLATLVIGAARALAGLPAGAGAEWRREVWAAVGLLRDELSTIVLALGLPGDGSTATGRTLGALRAAGQPVALTLRQLVRDAPRLDVAGRTVSICENPVVVADAADRLGSACAPLVCSNGQPGAAVLRLLRLLAAAGARLRFHGDFDWGGLRIGNVLHRGLPVTAWRYDARAYQDLLAAGLGRELTGPPIDAHWDSELGPAMRTAGRRIDEELVLDDLLVDLAT